MLAADDFFCISAELMVAVFRRPIEELRCFCCDIIKYELLRSGGGGGGAPDVFSIFILLSYEVDDVDVVVVVDADVEEFVFVMDMWDISRASDEMGCSVCRCFSSAKDADFCDFEGEEGAVLEPS